MQHRQWVTCSLSFPHHVTRNGRLLLRRLGVTCSDLLDYVEQSKVKPMHFRDNMAGERAAVRAQLKQKKVIPSSPIELFDDAEDDHVSRKHRMDEDDVRPSQRLRLSSPCTPSPTSRMTTPETPLSHSPSSAMVTPSSFFIRSPSIVVSSPRPQFNYDFLVPESTKPWLDGMYTMDMAAIFLAVDDKPLKKRFARLEDRIKFVLKKNIHRNTWNDQRRHWNTATEEERNIYKNFGHTPQGFWSKFPKTSRAH